MLQWLICCADVDARYDWERARVANRSARASGHSLELSADPGAVAGALYRRWQRGKSRAPGACATDAPCPGDRDIGAARPRRWRTRSGSAPGPSVCLSVSRELGEGKVGMAPAPRERR